MTGSEAPATERAERDQVAITETLRSGFHFDARRDAGACFVTCASPIRIDVGQSPPSVRIAYVTPTDPI